MIPLAAYSGRDSIGGFGMIAGGEFLLELERALLEIGLAPSEEQLRQMDRLRQLVLYWNSRLNLTRIVSDQEVACWKPSRRRREWSRLSRHTT